MQGQGSSLQLVEPTARREAKEFLIKFPQKALELSSRDSSDYLDPRIPAQASGWLKTLRVLTRVAASLRLRSKQDIGAIDEEVHEILWEALDQAKSECQEALSAAREVLSKEVPK